MKVKVKIAVSINDKGEWSANGYGKAWVTDPKAIKEDEDYCMSSVMELTEAPSREYWIETEVDTPEAITTDDVKITEVK